MPSQPMLTPYQREPLDPMYETVNPIMIAMPAAPANEYHTPSDVTVEDHGPSTEIEGIIQNAAAQWVDAFIKWFLVPPINTSITQPEPISPTYQSVLHREMETLFGTANHATAAVLVNSNDVASMTADHGISTEDVTRAPGIAQLNEAHHHAPCLAPAPCQWTGKGNSGTCGAQITCKSVPEHFRNTHSIRKLKADTPIDCWWEGCHGRVKRKYFVRHIRERHLGHPRKRKHPY